MKSHSSFWMKAAVGFFIFVLVLVGLRMLLWWQVHQEINALRERGIATTAAEFIAQLPKIPDEQNAAVQTIRAYNSIQFEPASLFRDRNFTLNILDEFNYFKTPTPSPEALEQVGEFLALNEKPFADMHQALQLPESLFPADYSRGVFFFDSKPLMSSRISANLYRVTCVYYAAKGNKEATFINLQDSLRLDSLYQNERLLIGQLLRMAVNAVSFHTLLDTLQRIELDEPSLSQLQAQIKAKPQTNLLTSAYEGELSGLCDFYLSGKHFSELGWTGTLATSSSPPSLKLPGKWFEYYSKTSLRWMLETLIHVSGLWDLNFLKTVEFYQNLIKAHQLPFPESVTELQKIEKEIEQLAFLYFVPKMVIPAVGKSSTRFHMNIAQLRAAETALAVERYRLKHNKLPDSLEQIAPEFIESIPLDPFDGKPLKYRKDGASFYVYSIGDNLTDDGGDPAKSKSNPKAIYGEDIVFFIERP